MPLNFKQRVITCVKSIPPGRVASYGQVAAACGCLRAARQVGGILRAIDAAAGDMPWWRVVNSRGRLSIKGNWTASKELQAQLLKKEGVRVNEKYQLNMETYRWRMG